jgi:hypothetical protein
MTAHLLATLSLVGLGGSLGWFAGRIAGRLLRRPSAHVSRMAEEGQFIGIGIGMSCWMVIVAHYLL